MPNQTKPRRQFLKDSVKASGLMIMSPLIPKITSAAATEKQKEIITNTAVGISPTAIKPGALRAKDFITIHNYRD